MRVLVLNCGGSSLKYQLLEMPTEQVLAEAVSSASADKMPLSTRKPLAQPFVPGVP